MKKTIIIPIVIAIVIPFTYFGPLPLQNYFLTYSFSEEFNENLYTENTAFVRCNDDFWNPEFAYTFIIDNKVHIGFYKSDNLFYQQSDGWDKNRTGGTTVKNTTFEELLKMVKQDCSQFQKPKGNPDDETINWRYSPAEKIDYPSEVLDLYKEHGRSVESMDLFESVYGNPFQMTDKESEEVYNKIQKEGIDPQIAAMNKALTIENYRAGFLREYNALTDSQKAKMIATYGEWENLSDEELYEYGEKIFDDLSNERFDFGE